MLAKYVPGPVPELKKKGCVWKEKELGITKVMITLVHLCICVFRNMYVQYMCIHVHIPKK